ncbi:MAG: competence/damage-inducible protein A [Pseudomonadota bacterium]
MTTAAISIIGDELLSGRTPDVNGPLLLAWLQARGLEVTRLVWLPDDVGAIAEEVARLSARCDWLFCSGGVGPTHDDVTYAAVAQAFGVPLERRAELVTALDGRRSPLPPAALRMADVPAGADLWWDGDIRYPLVVMRNALLFPGTPHLFRARLEAVAHRFQGTPVRLVRLFLTARETAFAALLAEAAKRFPQVRVGSYPRTSHDVPWLVMVTLESRDEAALEACLAWSRGALGEWLLE